MINKTAIGQKTMQDINAMQYKMALESNRLIIRLLPKGQVSSEWNFGAFNFPKNQRKNLKISALTSKEWLNQKNKGILFC